MMEIIRNLDSRQAAGVLARAALSLESVGNPSAQPVMAGEEDLRRGIVNEARQTLGLAPSDVSDEANQRVADFLDQEADTLIGPLDTQAALRRLAESGDLPTDLYEITLAGGQFDWLGKRLGLESELIEATIRRPHREQHYGRGSQREPSLVSLFSHSFKTKWPFKDFTLLVAAHRDNLVLTVFQAWRLYPAFVDVHRSPTLVDLLEKFASVYGANFTADGRKASFFLTLNKPLPAKFEMEPSPRPSRTFTICQFVQQSGPLVAPTAALVVAIDLDRYTETLDKMTVSKDQILDESLHRPTAAQATN
jgi:hypothetical protein